MNDTNCNTTTSCNKASSGSGLILAVVLYILLAIILGSFRTC